VAVDPGRVEPGPFGRWSLRALVVALGAWVAIASTAQISRLRAGVNFHGAMATPVTWAGPALSWGIVALMHGMH
jgi:hypothetical protein